MKELLAREANFEVYNGFLFAQLSRVNESGCCFLLFTLVGSIKTCLVILSSCRNNVVL